MKQCEFYYEVITPQGTVMYNMFASKHLKLDEKHHCPNPSVDYIIIPSIGQKVYLCAEHYDGVKSDGEVATFTADDDVNYDLEEFVQWSQMRYYANGDSTFAIENRQHPAVEAPWSRAGEN